MYAETDPQDSSALKVGGAFRRWRLERVIGQGGMGTVFLARHEIAGRAGAIKVLRAPEGAPPERAAMARFQVEAELYVSLRHPNLPDFFDAEVLPDGTAVLVLEYLDGYDLADALARVGRLAVGDALFVASEVLRALAAMHETSVHRDVKPSNVFLCRRPRLDAEGRLEKGRVRLLDFGVAKLKGRQGPTAEHRTVGTSSYMSPEQLTSGDVDARSDQYSLGLVLYEALTGHPLFVPDRDEMPPLEALLYQHVHTPAPDLRAEMPEVPADVAAFASRLLAKAPGDRYARTSDALEIARALRQTHREASKLFREEVDDLALRIDELREERWATSSHRAASSGAHAATRVPAAKTEPKPPSHTTRRMKAPTVSSIAAERESVPPDATRVIERLRAVLRAPRCFQRPALERFDTVTGARVATLELPDGESVLGSGPHGVTHVIHGEGIEPRHAVVTVRRDRRVDVRLVEGVPIVAGALRVEGVSTPWGGHLAHGTRVDVGHAALTLVDLATSADDGARRASPARLSVRDPRGRHVSEVVLGAPLTLLGASTACDVVIPCAALAEVVAAVWLRGDGAFEWVDVDTSVLPHGDPIVRTAIVTGSARVELPAGFSAFIDDPGRGEAHAPAAPLLAETPAPARAHAAPAFDRLLVCGRRGAGLRSALPDAYPLAAQRLVIGKSRACDIVVDHDLVSPEHVELIRAPLGYSVRDLGSEHGTFINRRRVEGGLLGDSDYLDLGGGVSLKLERSPAAPRAETPRAADGAIATFLRRFRQGKSAR